MLSARVSLTERVNIMSKTSKRIISLVLTLVMVLSISVSALAWSPYTAADLKLKDGEFERYTVAADANAPYGYEYGYLSLGDSIPTGYNRYDNVTDIGFTSVQGSYTQLVAEAFGLTHWNFSCIGYRTNELLAVVGEQDKVKFDDYWNSGYTWMLNPDGSSVMWNDAPWYGEAAVASSRLITIQVGNNDIFTAPLRMAAVNILETAGVKYAENEAKIAELKAKIDAIANNPFANFTAMLIQMLSVINEIDYYGDYTLEFLKLSMKGMSDFQRNLPVIINKLKATNPDCTIAIVGMFNPYKKMTLTDKTHLQLGRAFDLMTTMMNTYMKTLCRQTGCTFVDCTKTETFMDINGVTLKTMLTEDAHPTDDGHLYLAQQVVNALPV